MTLTLGTFAYQRALVAGTTARVAETSPAALEYYHYDGPWERPDDYERWNGIPRLPPGDSLGGWSLTAHGLRTVSGSPPINSRVGPSKKGSWTVTAFSIPGRAGGPAGTVSRESFTAEANDAVQHLRLRHPLRLRSHLELHLLPRRSGERRPVRTGGQRWITGINAMHRWSGHLGSAHTDNAVALELRYDAIDNGLYEPPSWNGPSPPVRTKFGNSVVALWGESWIQLSPDCDSTSGLRADYYLAKVEAYREANSGAADDWMLNPKAQLVYRPWKSTEFSFNAGSGFHSNDARGATIRIDPVTGEPVRPVDPLVRATGFDIGIRTFTANGYHGTLTASGSSSIRSCSSSATAAPPRRAGRAGGSGSSGPTTGS